MNDETSIEKSTKTIIMRKSTMKASGKYDYRKLTHKRKGFLSCVMKEAKEELCMTYDLTGMTPFSEILKEKRSIQLAALMDIAGFSDLRRGYNFSLEPENLFCDIRNNIYVMQRDIYEKGVIYDSEKFLAEYKALIGCVLQRKYTYQDYYNGGIDLLKKDQFLNIIYGCQTPEEIYKVLEDEHERFAAENKATKMEVSRWKYRWGNVMLLSFGTLFLSTISFVIWFAVWIWPYRQAVSIAQNAWLEADYAGVIDALEPVKVDRMDRHQKYILAESTVRSESLTQEQKENIFSILSLTGEEKLLDYWIYIGRMEVKKAIDIALQMSDNQMQIYAYLKEKYMIEMDTKLTGEEKSSSLERIEEQINTLAQVYHTEGLE